jgi:hypothetical protein
MFSGSQEEYQHIEKNRGDLPSSASKALQKSP